MKKALFTLVFLLVATNSMFAQTKSYIHLTIAYDTYDIYNPSSYLPKVIITGDVPENIENGNYKPGELLNKLSDLGYTIESHTATSLDRASNDYRPYALDFFVLSKTNTSPATSAKEGIVIDNNEENANEVARYNLQGIPVREADKGLQIIVYSNYTTKTVLVQ